MNQTLGIFVSTDHHMNHLAGLTRAAVNRGIRVMIFLTNRGVLLTQRPELGALFPLADIRLCRVSFDSFGLHETLLPELTPDRFTNQAWHRDMIDRCDRYVTL